MPRPLRRAVSAGLITLLASAGVVGLGASVAQADSTQTFSGTLQAGDATWQRPNGCEQPGMGVQTNYDAQQFTVDETGGYVVEMTASTLTIGDSSGDGDGYFYLYEGTFDPTAPTVNCIASNDDGAGNFRPRIQRLLTAGQQYTLVTTQFNVAATTEATFEYTNTVTGTQPIPTLSLAEGQSEVATADAPARLAVTFSEPVTGFGADDVEVLVEGSFVAEPVVSVTGSGAQYVVEIATGEGFGDVQVQIAPRAAVDQGGNESLGAQAIGYSVGPGVRVAPVDASISTAPAAFDIEFDAPVEGFEAADLIVSGSAGATTVDLLGAGAQYQAVVSGFAGPGTIELLVPSGAADTPVVGGEGFSFLVPNAASNTATITYAPIVAEARPTVTVEQAAGQADPTSTLPVAFDVTFSEPIDGLEAGDVQVGGTAGSTRVAIETLAGEAPNTAYRVTVLDAAHAGTISVSIPANAVVDQAGLGNLPSISVDDVVTYAPVVAPASSAPPVAGAGGTLPQTGGAPGGLLAVAALLLVATGGVAVRRSALRR